MSKYDLDTILNNDPLGILEYKKRDKAKNSDQRLVDSFEEINDFYGREQREPEKNDDVGERNLRARLDGIRSNAEKTSFLKKYDRYNLLKKIEKKVEVKSIDDIFENDELGILNTDEVDIFTLKNVPNNKERETADYIARQEVCADFDKYEDILKQCQADIKSGKNKLIKYAGEQDINQGDFFVLKGVLVYVAEKGEKTEKNGKVNYRLKCIFENGTESNMLLRSLSRELYRNGSRVVRHKKKILDHIKSITDKDNQTGYIYILKSLSKDDRILTKKNLYKIGFSKGAVEERIKNAENDPTYLMAPVSIVATYKCFNMNPQKLEQLLHKFFGNSCLDIDIIDGSGEVYSPREWFIAPFKVIEMVVEMIVSGSIVNYRYDVKSEEIVLR